MQIEAIIRYDLVKGVRLTPVFFPVESHGQKSLGYSPWESKELDIGRYND